MYCVTCFVCFPFPSNSYSGCAHGRFPPLSKREILNFKFSISSNILVKIAWLCLLKNDFYVVQLAANDNIKFSDSFLLHSRSILQLTSACRLYIHANIIRLKQSQLPATFIVLGISYLCMNIFWEISAWLLLCYQGCVSYVCECLGLIYALIVVQKGALMIEGLS